MNNWTPPTIRFENQSQDSGELAIADKLLSSLEKSVQLAGESAEKNSTQWVLDYEHPYLRLMRPDHVIWQVDFASGKALHRSREADHGIATLAKALGLKTFKQRFQKNAVIIDATAGWGQDAWALASLGHSMVLLESHPIVHALLKNGLDRALLDEQTAQTANGIRLIQGDAIEQLNTINGDVIYLDPMYPPRARKKAQSKKAMQFLHTLLGPVDESKSKRLLKEALTHKASRVVVKRPKSASALPTPTNWVGQQFSVSSPNTRYDVYINQQSPLNTEKT